MVVGRAQEKVVIWLGEVEFGCHHMFSCCRHVTSRLLPPAKAVAGWVVANGTVACKGYGKVCGMVCTGAWFVGR